MIASLAAVLDLDTSRQTVLSSEALSDAQIAMLRDIAVTCNHRYPAKPGMRRTVELCGHLEQNYCAFGAQVTYASNDLVGRDRFAIHDGIIDDCATDDYAWYRRLVVLTLQERLRAPLP